MNYLNGLKTLMIVAIATVAFSSCSEDQTSLSINDIKGTAQLIGSFTYDDGQTVSSSLTNATSVKPVMNTKVYVKVSNKSLDPNSNAKGYTIYEATTDAQGEYKITIPAVETGTDVTIQAASFEGKHYESNSSSSTTTGSNTVTTKDGVYQAEEIEINVMPNAIVAVGKVEYDFEPFDHKINHPYN